MTSCCTVKSVEEEINKQFSFVSMHTKALYYLLLWLLICKFLLQKLEVKGRTYYMQAESYAEKESWIGALGKAMIKQSVMIDDNMDDLYM